MRTMTRSSHTLGMLRVRQNLTLQNFLVNPPQKKRGVVDMLDFAPMRTMTRSSHTLGMLRVCQNFTSQNFLVNPPQKNS